MNVDLVIKTVFEKLAKHKLLVVDSLVEQSITESVTKKVRKLGNMCRGTTARGTACSRKAQAGRKFCFQHDVQPAVVEDEPDVVSGDDMSELEDDDALASESDEEFVPRVPEKRHKKKKDRKHRKHKKAKKAKRPRVDITDDRDYAFDVYDSKVVQFIKNSINVWSVTRQMNGLPHADYADVLERCDNVLEHIKRKKTINYGVFDSLFHYIVNDYSTRENSQKFTAGYINRIPDMIE